MKPHPLSQPPQPSPPSTRHDVHEYMWKFDGLPSSLQVIWAGNLQFTLDGDGATPQITMAVQKALVTGAPDAYNYITYCNQVTSKYRKDMNITKDTRKHIETMQPNSKVLALIPGERFHSAPN